MQHVDEGLLHAYVDGECDEAQARRLDDHLAVCAECRERLDEARRIATEATALIASLAVGDIAAPAWEELERRAAVSPDPSASPRPASESPDTGSDRTPRIEIAGRGRGTAGGLRLAAGIVVAFAIGWFARSLQPPGSTELQQIPQAPNAVAEPEPTGGDRFGRVEEEVAAPETSEPVAGQAGSLTEADRAAGPAPGEGADEAFELDAVAAAPPADAPPALRDPALPAAPPPTPQPTEGEAGGGDVVTGGAAVNEDARAAARKRAVGPEASPVSRPAAEGAYRADADGARRESSTEQQERANVEPDEARQSNDVLRSIAEPLAVVGEQVSGAESAGYAGLVGGFEDSVAVLLRPEDAAAWLGAAPRQFDELSPARTALVPGSSIAGSRSDRPGLHQTFVFDDGAVVVLMQQYVGDGEADTFFQNDDGAAQQRAAARSPAEPDVPREFAIVAGAEPQRPVLRWRDPAGYWLYLTGTVDLERLRDLAARVR